MNKIASQSRKIAIALLVIWMINLTVPYCAFALTSGPAAPENKGFQPAGVSDMVNLESGDFKYNIPLMDIDGYPINLDYASGTGIDDEASWVGLGWSLTPGAINRQMRGIPDDFRGDGDQMTTVHTIKPKVTTGGKVTAKLEFTGIGANGSFTCGIFNDNYYGVGAEFGLNAGMSFSAGGDGLLTAGLGLGVTSNTQSGVDFTPSMSLSISEKTGKNMSANAGLTASFGYNSRSGMKGLSLGTSYGFKADKDVTKQVKGADGKMSDVTEHEKGNASGSLGGTSISYNTEPIQPSIQIPYKSTYDSFSVDVGFAAFTAFLSIGGTGYRSIRDVKNPSVSKPAYGFLYAERGKNNPAALMDFVREKDNPIIPGIPDIAIPVHTPDLWSYTSQTGSGQFRLFRRGTGAFFDNEAVDTSVTSTTGGDVGLGLLYHGGVTHYDQHTSSSTHKWTKSNAFLAKGDFANEDAADPNTQGAYFKLIGEKNQEDAEVNSKLNGTDNTAVTINNVSAADSYNKGTVAQQKVTKTSRRPTATTISYLTASEGIQIGAALDLNIPTYPLYNYSGNFVPPADHKVYPITSFGRTDDYRRGNHISQMTITDGSGKRMVYGIPVYNTVQDEYTFAINLPKKPNGDIDYPINTNRIAPSNLPTNIGKPGFSQGLDNSYTKESKPGYATSFLLSGILSPDYVDRTGDGITPDDQGTAIKFNYSKIIGSYHWRTPYSGATLNKCLQADPDDDKASVVYGEKELWYISSIESKTKIAYFITEDRNDGLGVNALDWNYVDQNNSFNNFANPANPSAKQRCLREIRLYSKADMSRPIKVVKLQYSYSLCPGVENSSSGGKLTLDKLWFEYGNSHKGQDHPYSFRYKTQITGQSTPIAYGNMLTDRWGTYKDPAENAPFNLGNEEFPYTDQANTNHIVDESVALWHLNSVTLPTGGLININYESGDYAYVQNKRAMTMAPIDAVFAAPKATIGNPAPTFDPTSTNFHGASELNGAPGLFVRINLGAGHNPSSTDPASVTTWFKNNYLNGSNYLYTKFCVRMANNVSADYGAKDDYVPSYNEIQPNGVTLIGNGLVNVLLVDQTQGSTTANPVSMAAWQRLKNDYPRYAYPGFDARARSSQNSFSAAILAIIDAAKNLSELRQSLYQKAQDRYYASHVDLQKSFVRLVKQDGHKLGGGARVKQISISDQWNTQSDSQLSPTATYGQAYTYQTDDGQSSGVASYEPAVGNDENPLKQPVPYMQKIKGGIDNYFCLEEPFGESFFPSASIVYSKVVVHDLDGTGLPTSKNGYSMDEFYTAKDYPVRVEVGPLTSNSYKPAQRYSFLETNSDDELCLSQGYKVELNDMHGKPKATHTYNGSGGEIASTVYYYNSTDDGNGGQMLSNKVSIITPDGKVTPDQVIGRDIDFFTDFREQETSNHGRTINLGFDALPIPIPFLGFLPIPHFPINSNNDYKLFRSASAIKVIQSYGIVSKVVKTVNGSTNTSENLAYDGITGDVLLTKTNNEFKQDVFSLKIPAYWAYTGMGPAYQSLGTILTGIQTDDIGQLSDASAALLSPGDEFINPADYQPYWVVDEPANAIPSGNITSNLGYTSNRFIIAKNGRPAVNFDSKKMVKIVRSGHRNLLGDALMSVVCLSNPIINGYLAFTNGTGETDLTTTLKVLNATASTYDENWPSGVPEYGIREDQTKDWRVGNESPINPYSSNNPTYSDSEGFEHTSQGTFSGPPASDYWIQKFPQTSIVFPLSSILQSNYNEFDVPFTLDHDGTYLVGYESGNGLTFGFNCDPPIKTNYLYHSSGHYGWDVQEVYLHKGTNTVYIQTQNIPLGAMDGVGLEIYDNTLTDINFAGLYDGKNLNIKFSTKDLIGRTDIAGAEGSPGDFLSYFHYFYQDPSFTPVGACSLPVAVNPYVSGFKGNWRPYQTKVIQQNRTYTSDVRSPSPAVGIVNAGYIKNFFSDWYLPLHNTGPWIENTSPSAGRWVTANTVTLYDKYSQQVENKDALNRYSSAKFDFNGELPAAVASNAMNREIYASSFEDSKFTIGELVTNPSNPPRLFVGSTTGNAGSGTELTIDRTISHSGNCSVQLSPSPGGMVMSTIAYQREQRTASYLDINSTYQFVGRKIGTDQIVGLYPNGFEPVHNKSYLFNVWVKDNRPGDKSVNILLYSNYNNTEVPVQLTCKAVVEGWKLLEGTIDLHISGLTVDNTVNPTQYIPLSLRLLNNSNGTVHVDDLRIHPKDSQMKTYAYDDRTLRLMAELDENAFATFYEYDDEGLLVRVKKETEKGIVTIKESRSSYLKTQ